jgi:hypothetical protein
MTKFACLKKTDVSVLDSRCFGFGSFRMKIKKVKNMKTKCI